MSANLLHLKPGTLLEPRSACAAVSPVILQVCEEDAFFWGSVLLLGYESGVCNVSVDITAHSTPDCCNGIGNA